MPEKVFVIGIDGATWDLLIPWMKKGKLPNMSELMKQGVWATLESTFPPLSPAAWTSLATGKNPGNHGILDHIVRKPHSYEFSPVNSKLRRSKALWHIISEAKKKVGIINVPLTYPPDEVNGFMISGMYTPSEEVIFTHPPALIDELNKKIGGYMIFGPRSKENYDKALEGFYQVKKNRLKATLCLMKDHEWDFFFVVFNSTDFIQHRFWRFMDSSHPMHESDASQEHKDAILEFYRDLDRDLGKILKNLGEQTTVIVMSDHGAGPLYGYLYLNNWLLKKGFLKLKKDVMTRLKYFLFKNGFTPFNFFKFSSKFKLGLTDKVISRVKISLSEERRNLYQLFLSYRDIDWQQTKAFALGGNLAGVYINLKGREEKGIIKSGEEYNLLREKISEELKTLIDPQTGDQMVDRIYYREQLYSGKFIENIPDIVFSFKDNLYMCFGMHEFASNRIIEPSLWFSGSHQMNGILIMKGKGIKREKNINSQKIIDLSPTVLYLLNLKIPSDMEGKVIEEAIEEEHLKKRPVKYRKVSTELPISHFEYSEEEERRIKQKLKDIGYFS